MLIGYAAMSGLAICALLAPTVIGVDGKRHQPIKESQGKPIAIIFVRHDCPICNAYAPEIGRIESAYGGKAQIDIVYSESRLTPKEVRNHAKEFAIDHAGLFLDSKSEFAEACGVSFTPEVAVYDEKGKKVYTGRIDDRYIAFGQQRPEATTHEFRQALDAVLAHQRPKAASGPPVGCILSLPHKS